MTLKNIVSKTGGIENFTKKVSSELKKKKKMVLFSHVPLPAVKKWMPEGVGLGILAVAVISAIIWQYRPTGYIQAAVEENPNPPELPLTISTERDETAQES